MRVTQITTNLPVADVEEAKAFYRDFFGLSTQEFDLGWVARMTSPDTGAHVQLVSGDATAAEDSAISVHTDDVHGALAEAVERGYEIVHPHPRGVGGAAVLRPGAGRHGHQRGRARRVIEQISITWGQGDADDLLRRVVADLVGGSPDAVVVGRACPRCGSSEHGRPVVLGRPDAFVSLSRAGTTCVAVATRLGPVGVDVERVGAAEVGGSSTRDWVRDEAWRKADGSGITAEPDATVPRRVDDLDAPDGFVAAVCVLGEWD